MGLSELTGLPRRKCKDVLQCKEVLKHRGTENTEEGGGRGRRGREEGELQARFTQARTAGALLRHEDFRHVEDRQAGF